MIRLGRCEIELMYEQVLDSSKGMDGTRIVMDKFDLCCKISLPSSTIEIMWWNAGPGYKTMLFFIMFGA